MADLDNLYAVIKREKGQLGIVFANAGGGTLLPLDAVIEEHFDQAFNINVKGLLFSVQKAFPLLKDGSSIVLNPSIAGITRMEASACTLLQRLRSAHLPAPGPLI